MKKIINNILHRFKEDSLSKHKGMIDRKVEYRGLKEIKTCLVFWTAGTESNIYLKKLAGKLKEAKLDKLCFIPDGVEILETDDMVCLRNGDLGFGGKVQNDRLHEILARKYDLLINLTTTSNVLVQYVLTNSQAGCIACMKDNGGNADIMVDGVNTPSEFIDGLTEILSEINRY